MSRTTVAACLVLAMQPRVTAAAPQRAAAREFGSAITIVSLPVFVTDRDARAVVGLTQDDFEVTDDGRPMKVVGFRAIDAADAGPVGQTPLSLAARRQFLLLFDLSFSSVSGLVRARQAALTFIESGLAPADLAAVATLSANRGVKLVVGFTSDRIQLKKAVASLGVLKLDRKTDPLGLVYDLTEMGAAYADTALDDSRRLEFDDTVRQIQQRYQVAERVEHRQRILGALDGLGQLARALAGLQGRKQIVFLSSGFDATPLLGEQSQDAASTSDAVTRGRFWEVRSEDRFGDSAVRAEMEHALRHFASSDAVVHAVDLSGLAARGDTRFQSREPVRGSGQESLARIAGISGGRLFKGTNDIEAALNEVLEMSRHYYLLAFEPQGSKGPGHFHRLRVRVKGKGRDASHRSGYFERAPYKDRTPLARQFEAAEVIAKGAVKGEIEVRAMAVPYGSSGGKVTLPVVLEIDGESLLSGVPQDRLGLEIYGYAIGEDGGVEDLIGFVSNLDLGKVASRLRSGGLQCHATFSLAPGRHSLRFLVREAESGRFGATWLDVSVPAFDSGGVLLFPPLFMDDPQRWLVVLAQSRATAGPVASPFRVASEAFAPRARPRLSNGKPASVCLLAFDGGIAYDPGASFEIKAALLDAAGDSVPVGRIQLARSVAEGDGFRRFVLSFTPEDVAAGDYSLRVRLRDPASGRISEAFQLVRFD